MAGEAKTDNFMLGTATLCVGPMAQLMALGVRESVGLAKNILLRSEVTSADLTQGVRNSLVYTMMTGNTLTLTGEVYEYSAKNLAYSASLDGSVLEEFVAAATTVKTIYAAPVAPALLGAPTLELTSPTGLAEGDSILVQAGAKDQVFARKIVSIASDVATLDYGLPVAVAVGAKVTKVAVTALGSQDEPPFLAAKLIGELANGKPVHILIPKIKIVSGVNLSFQTGDYQNMPWELKVFDQLPSDPFYEDFATASPKGTLAKAKLAMVG